MKSFLCSAVAMRMMEQLPPERAFEHPESARQLAHRSGRPGVGEVLTHPGSASKIPLSIAAHSPLLSRHQT
jgi:hypothetical protein